MSDNQDFRCECMKRADRPPAILLGGDTPIGLTVVRELGQQNVPVHVIARSNRGLGLYSRWAATRHIRPIGEAQTIDLLNRIAEVHGARHVIAVSETDLMMLRNAADDNKLTGIRALVPPIGAREASQAALPRCRKLIYFVLGGCPPRRPFHRLESDQVAVPRQGTPAAGVAEMG